MTNFIFTILIIFLIFWGYHKYDIRNEEVSYDSSGNMIVRVECDNSEKYKCLMIVGKYCKDSGYKVESNKNSNDKTIVNAICGERKQNIFLNFLEH